MILGVALSVLSVLFVPTYRDCLETAPCLAADDAAEQGLPDRFVPRASEASSGPSGVPDSTPVTDPEPEPEPEPEPDSAPAAPVCGRDFWDWTCEGSDVEGESTSIPPEPACDAVEPEAPTPDMAAMTWPEGRIISETGGGPVITGMETEFRWEGPTSVSWTQTGTPGLTEDCSPIAAPVETFTAQLHSLVFEFEEGSQLHKYTTGNKVMHRYNELSHEGGYTVCVYAAWEIPGSGYTSLVRSAELDHEVMEIRSTLVE